MLPKLLYLGTDPASGVDSRVGMLFNLLAMAASAAVLIVAARRLRGRASCTDALLAVACLSSLGLLRDDGVEPCGSLGPDADVDPRATPRR